MKKPNKYLSPTTSLEASNCVNLGEVFDFFEEYSVDRLTLEQLRSIKLSEITNGRFILYKYSGPMKNPNYEQELKEYNRYIEIENAKKIVSKNTDSFISSLEQMAKTARQDVEAAKKKLIELGVEV